MQEEQNKFEEELFRVIPASEVYPDDNEDEDDDSEFDWEDDFKSDLNQLLLDSEFMNDDKQTLNLQEYDDSQIWWLNDESRNILNRGYLLRGETVLGAIHRICNAIAGRVACEQIPYNRVYKNFVRNIVLGWQSFSSPVWANSGLERGLPISCFNVYVGDSMDSIASKHGEVVIQTKIGGGTSGYFGELRGKGSIIQDNGKSNGAVAFMQMFDTAMSVVSQGSTRRGAFAAYLDIDHSDIEEFLTIRSIGSPIQNLYTGVCVPDWWMNDMVNGGDVEKRELWAKVIKARKEKGMPYILFIDTINRNKPAIYKELGERIHSSNLCFTGDTMIAIADGTNARSIKELAEYSNGKIKFPVYSATNKVSKNNIGKSNGGIIKNYYWKPEIKNAVAFKTGTKKVVEILLSNGDKFRCTEDHLLATKYGKYIEAKDSIGIELEPFFTYTKQNNEARYRHINSISNCVNNKEIYDNNLDIIPEKKISPEHQTFLNIEQNRIDYINKHFYKFENNDIILTGLFVESITECGIEDVYDLTVEDNSNFYIITSTEDANYENCQGILVHNCSEIALPSSESESFVCCLSSMNLELYDDWKESDAIFYAVLFLDGIMSEFIEKTEDYHYLEAAHKFAKRHRAIGLGVMGYHSYLQRNMIPFESWEAKQINAEIFKRLQKESTDASIELGEIYGYAPIFEELKELKDDDTNMVAMMRNTTVMAIAPTTSSSGILGQVSPGIEPYSSNYFKAGLAKGNFMRTNKYLKKLLQEKDMDNEDVWYSIMMKHGSVQHLDFLTPEEKSVFKTFKEISPSEIITQAAQRQQYIDQMQSLNLLIPDQMDPRDVNRLLIQAWKSGVKALYYQRGVSVSKEMMTEFVNCSSCVV